MNPLPDRFDLVDRSVYQLPDGVAIDRPRLVRALDDAVTARVTLISAPAGSGKSTVLHQWAETGAFPSIHVAPGDASAFRAAEHTPEIRVDEPFVVIVDEADPTRNPLTTITIEEILRWLPAGARLIAARRSPWPAALDGDLDAASRVDERDLAFSR